MLRRALGRHPLAASFAVLAAVVLVAVLVVLPRLDGVEIASAAPDRDGRLAVKASWRLASAPLGELVVRAPSPAGGADDAIERRAVAAGRGSWELHLSVPPREAWVVMVELHPAGAGDGMLDRLQRSRRRALRGVAAAR